MKIVINLAIILITFLTYLVIWNSSLQTKYLPIPVMGSSLGRAIQFFIISLVFMLVSLISSLLIQILMKSKRKYYILVAIYIIGTISLYFLLRHLAIESWESWQQQ